MATRARLTSAASHRQSVTEAGSPIGATHPKPGVRVPRVAAPSGLRRLGRLLQAPAVPVGREEPVRLLQPRPQRPDLSGGCGANSNGRPLACPITNLASAPHGSRPVGRDITLIAEGE